MARASEGSGSTARLILVPTLISLVVTLWRLTGELLRWSESWFNPEAGGYGAIVGITWLAPVFGVYFAIELHRAGLGPASWMKAIGLSLLAMLILFGAVPLQAFLLHRSFLGALAYMWLVAVVAAGVSYPAWRRLFRPLFAYGVAVRLPVVLIMFLAMRGGWGTHYDAVPTGFPPMGWPARFVWLALLPQVLFWVSYTIVTGMFFGSLAAGWLGRRQALEA